MPSDGAGSCPGGVGSGSGSNGPCGGSVAVDGDSGAGGVPCTRDSGSVAPPVTGQDSRAGAPGHAGGGGAGIAAAGDTGGVAAAAGAGEVPSAELCRPRAWLDWPLVDGDEPLPETRSHGGAHSSSAAWRACACLPSSVAAVSQSGPRRESAPPVPSSQPWLYPDSASLVPLVPSAPAVSAASQPGVHGGAAPPWTPPLSQPGGPASADAGDPAPSGSASSGGQGRPRPGSRMSRS